MDGKKVLYFTKDFFNKNEEYVLTIIKFCLISSLERRTSSKIGEHYTLLTLLSYLPHIILLSLCAMIHLIFLYH